MHYQIDVYRFIQVGSPLFMKNIVRWYLSHSPVPSWKKVEMCLASGDQDIMMCCVGWIHNTLKDNTLQDLELKSIQVIAHKYLIIVLFVRLLYY